MSNQKFTGKKQAAISGPKSLAGIPAVDSMVKARHVLATKGLSNEQRK